MDIVLTKKGATFYPERDLDVFELGKLVEREGGEAYVRWQHRNGVYTLWSVTLDLSRVVMLIQKYLFKKGR